jgi:predicted nucleic acid-binding protein
LGAVSIQVLMEFYSAATRKLRMPSHEAEQVIADLGTWWVHRPGHKDVLQAVLLHRTYEISWWDALLINSANELECEVLWTEDLAEGQRYGSVVARNPFR